LQEIIKKLEILTTSLSKSLTWIAITGLVGMLVIIIIDIIANKVFSSPIPGAIEIISFLGVITTAFAIAHTYILKGHIKVEFLTMRLPLRVQSIIASFILILGIILFALLAWRSYEYGHTLQVNGEVSMTQKIPVYPFAYAIAFCCIPTCMVLLVELIKSSVRAVSR